MLKLISAYPSGTKVIRGPTYDDDFDGLGTGCHEGTIIDKKEYPLKNDLYYWLPVLWDNGYLRTARIGFGFRDIIKTDPQYCSCLYPKIELTGFGSLAFYICKVCNKEL